MISTHVQPNRSCKHGICDQETKRKKSVHNSDSTPECNFKGCMINYSAIQRKNSSITKPHTPNSLRKYKNSFKRANRNWKTELNLWNKFTPAQIVIPNLEILFTSNRNRLCRVCIRKRISRQVRHFTADKEALNQHWVSTMKILKPSLSKSIKPSPDSIRREQLKSFAKWKKKIKKTGIKEISLRI